MLLLHIKEHFTYNYGIKRSAYNLPTKHLLCTHMNFFFFFNLLHLKKPCKQATFFCTSLVPCNFKVPVKKKTPPHLKVYF